jgi:TMEM175 potassium channel family protein
VATGRVEAFSDGVFAVAITVLVFGLLPVGSAHVSAAVLLAAWPHYVAYVVSFLTIGIMWMNHHTIIAHVRRVDRPLLTLNLLLLMGVVAIPFPTMLVAANMRDTSGGGAAAVSYGLVMVAISVGFTAVWIYVVRHGPALGAAVPQQALRRSVPRFTVGLAVYVLGTLAAFFSALLAVAIYGALAIYYLFEHLPIPAGDGDPGAPPPGERETG